MKQQLYFCQFTYFLTIISNNQFGHYNQTCLMNYPFNKGSQAHSDVTDTPFFEQPITKISIFDDIPQTQNAFQFFNDESERKQNSLIGELEIFQREEPADQQIIHFHPQNNFKQKTSNYNNLQMSKHQRILERGSLRLNGPQEIDRPNKKLTQIQLKKDAGSKHISSSLKDRQNQLSNFSLFKVNFNNKNYAEEEKNKPNKIEKKSEDQSSLLKINKIQEQKFKQIDSSETILQKQPQNSNFNINIKDQNKSSNFLKSSNVEDKIGKKMIFNLRSSRVLDDINSKASRAEIQKNKEIDFSTNNRINYDRQKKVYDFVSKQPSKSQIAVNQQIHKSFQVSNVQEVKLDQMADNSNKNQFNKFASKTKNGVQKRIFEAKLNIIENKPIKTNNNSVNNVFTQKSIEQNKSIIEQKKIPTNHQQLNLNLKQKLDNIQTFNIVKTTSKEPISEPLGLKERLKNIGLRQTEKLQLKSIANTKGFMFGDKLHFGKPDSKITNRLTNAHEKEGKQSLNKPIFTDKRSESVQINNNLQNQSQLLNKIQKISPQNDKQFTMPSKPLKQSEFSKLMMQVLEVMQQAEKLRQKCSRAKNTYRQLAILSNNLQIKINQINQVRDK